MGLVVTAAAPKRGQIGKSLFGSSASSVVGSAPWSMPWPKRPAADLHHHVRVARYRSCDVRARQPRATRPSTAGGARSRAREFCSISSCTGNGHASFSCSRHSVPYGECRERIGSMIGSHNSCALRRRCKIALEDFDAPCRPLERGSHQSFHMMVTVSTGRIRLVVESYGSLVGGGTLSGRVLGYFLS